MQYVLYAERVMRIQEMCFVCERNDMMFVKNYVCDNCFGVAWWHKPWYKQNVYVDFF